MAYLRANGRALWLAWMNNWTYADAIPADGGWRGSMTLPRELALACDGTNLELIHRPPAELAHLRGRGRSWANETISGASTLLADVRARQWRSAQRSVWTPAPAPPASG